MVSSPAGFDENTFVEIVICVRRFLLKTILSFMNLKNLRLAKKYIKIAILHPLYWYCGEVFYGGDIAEEYRILNQNGIDNFFIAISDVLIRDILVVRAKPSVLWVSNMYWGAVPWW